MKHNTPHAAGGFAPRSWGGSGSWVVAVRRRMLLLLVSLMLFVVKEILMFYRRDERRKHRSQTYRRRKAKIRHDGKQQLGDNESNVRDECQDGGHAHGHGTCRLTASRWCHRR